MGCSLGPKNTTVFNNSKFYFDASMPWAAIGATTFLNPKFVNGSYSNYELDSDTNFVSIAGTGVSKYLDLKQLQQFRVGLYGAGTFNQVTSFTWIAVIARGSNAQSNTFFRIDDSTGNFSVTSDGNFAHQHSGTTHTSTGLTLLNNLWNHLALIRNGTSCNLYVNNVLSFTYTLVNNNGTADANFRLGLFPGSLVDVAYVAWMPAYVMGASDIQYNYRILKNRFGLS
jgi:hypothetical protein